MTRQTHIILTAWPIRLVKQNVNLPNILYVPVATLNWLSKKSSYHTTQTKWEAVPLTFGLGNANPRSWSNIPVVHLKTIFLELQPEGQSFRSMSPGVGKRISQRVKFHPLTVFANKVLLRQSAPTYYLLFTAALTLQCQSEIVATETVWPAKPKIFTVWFFTEKGGSSPTEK